MKYRALIRIGLRRYWTEWFDTLEEAKNLKEDADIQNIVVYCIEDENFDEVEV